MNDFLEIARLSCATKLKMAFGSYPRGPLIIYFSPTELCNFRCQMCCIGRPETVDRSAELGTPRILSMLREARASGTKILALWGGEPLIHKDVVRIVEEAHGLGMHVYIATNGYLLGARLRTQLLKAGLDTMSVSLDHSTAAGHDMLRGKPGAFDTIVSNLEAMVRESGGRCNIGLNMLVHRQNLEEIPRMVRLAKKIGLKWVKFNPALSGYPFNALSFDDPRMRLTAAEVAVFARVMRQARTEMLESGMYTNSRPYLEGMAKHFDGQDLSRGCRAGFLSVNINSRGDVTICTRDARVMGNVNSASFPDIWHSEGFRSARRSPDRAACRHCMQSCYAESSHRLNISFHMKNLGTSLREIGFTKNAVQKMEPEPVVAADTDRARL